MSTIVNINGISEIDLNLQGITTATLSPGIVAITNSGLIFTQVSLTPIAAGNFTVAHGISTTILGVWVNLTSGGAIWFQTPMWDATNLYLTASAGGLTATAIVIHY